MTSTAAINCTEIKTIRNSN